MNRKFRSQTRTLRTSWTKLHPWSSLRMICFKMQMHVDSAAAGIAQGKALLAEGKKKLQDGKSLASQAVTMFQNNADPLGPPPQNPKEWDEINSSISRAEAKARMLDDTLEEVQRCAKEAGISDQVTTAAKGFSVEKEQSQAFSTQQDDKLMAF